MICDEDFFSFVAVVLECRSFSAVSAGHLRRLRGQLLVRHGTGGEMETTLRCADVGPHGVGVHGARRRARDVASDQAAQ